MRIILFCHMHNEHLNWFFVLSIESLTVCIAIFCERCDVAEKLSAYRTYLSFSLHIVPTHNTRHLNNIRWHLYV